MRNKTFFLPALLLLCVTFSGCNPVRWWNERPLLPNARVEAYTPEGAKRYEKEWKNKERHGAWRDYFPNGQLKEEYFYEEGTPVGKWRAWHENGQLAREAEYKDGREHGRWRTFSEEGKM